VGESRGRGWWGGSPGVGGLNQGVGRGGVAAWEWMNIVN